MKRTITLLACVLAFSISLMAQMPQDPTYGLTPNAKSFQRYGDIPVSLYTGTPNITIPLDTIRDVSLTLPISLSYHSGGVKADEHPGWVGLGWSLMLGGVITREVHDLPDEFDYIHKYGYYYSHDYLNDSRLWDEMDRETINSYLSATTDVIFNAYDTEPDKFNFQFEGYSGFLILDATGKWQIHSNRSLKIKEIKLGSYPIINNVIPKITSSVFKKFVLVSDDGTEYEFGNDAIDYSMNFRCQSTSCWIASAWHLEKIVYPNNDAVSFGYERGDYIVSMSYCDEIKSVGYSYEKIENSLMSGVGYARSDPYHGSLLSPVYLSSVKGKTFSLILNRSISNELNYDSDHFHHMLMYHSYIDPPFDTYDAPIFLSYDDNYDMNAQIAKIKWHKLDSISFVNEKNCIYKQIKFDYIENPLIRLALEQIRICNRFGITEESYKFKYRNLNKMPRYLANQSDHWGYYNGKDDPSSDIDTNKPNAQTLMYGTLEEITYPYGGKTVFDFEPHTYSKITHYREFGDMVDVDEEIAGGVRIRKITNIPNDSTPVLSREFRYVYNYGKKGNDSISSGILEGYPTYNQFIPLYESKEIIEEGSSVSLSHIINSSGLHIGYPEAVEIHSNGGYEIHRFTSCLDVGYRDVAPILSAQSPRFVPISSMAHYRGYPLWDRYYNNGGILLRCSEYDYTRLAFGELSVPSIFCAQTAYVNYSFYKTYLFNLVQNKKMDYVYDSSGENRLRTASYKTYNKFGQIKTDSIVTYLNSVPQNYVTRYDYEWESNPDFANRFYMQYIRDISHICNGKTLDCTTYEHSIANAIPYISDVYMHTADNEQKQMYNCSKVNVKGQPVIATYADNVPVVYLWGNDYLHPVATIKTPNIIQAVSSLGFSPELAPDYSYSLSNRISQLRERMPLCEITEYTYQPHIGIKSITAPSGKTTYYDYDIFGRLASISDTKRETVNSYIYSSVSSSGSEEDYTRAVKSYLNQNITIIGPRVINPDSTRYFWVELEDLNIPYRWSISGDSKAVKMDFRDKYIMLQPTDRWQMYQTLDLKLSVFNKDGSELWTQSHELLLREPHYSMELEKISSTAEKASVVMTVRPVDSNGAVSGVTVFVNGKNVGSVTKKTDEQFGLASNGVRGAIQIPRDYSADFYQITLRSSSLEDSWIYRTDELFSSQTQ